MGGCHPDRSRGGRRPKAGGFESRSAWLDAARETMDELLEYGERPGLFAEEVDPESRELLGNFPQGLSHLALVSAAAAVADAEGR